MFSPRALAVLALVASASAWPASDKSFLEPITELKDSDFGFQSPWSSFFKNFFTPLWNLDFHPFFSQTGLSVNSDDKKLEVVMNVKNYLKEELKVKVKGCLLIIRGTHESKKDDSDSFTTQFLQTYSLPENSSASDVVAQLSSDHYLVVSAPANGPANNDGVDIEVPIKETGKPYNKPETSEKTEKPVETFTEDDRKEETTPASDAEDASVNNIIPHGDAKS